jgi:thiaminase (transcriptional activator TenA)
MTMTFADELKLNAIEIWNNILTHKFINEISMDILPLNKFVFYLRQDHIFLKGFCNFLQNAKQKCEVEGNYIIKESFDGLYNSTINLEMEMQNQLLQSVVGISSSNDDINNNNPFETATKPNKITLEYTSYLMNVSSNGRLYEIISAMAPCPWSYFEIAKKLLSNKRQRYIKNEVYRKWIEFYSSYQSFKQVEDIKDILNVLSQNVCENDKKLMKKHFNTACKYEYNFWEMAYYSLNDNNR